MGEYMAVATYVRVSTTDQNLNRQLQATHDYAVDELGVEPPAIEVYRDKSTGTDVERSGYQELISDAEDGRLDAVVVHEVSRVARSISDLERTVQRLREAGVAVHIVSERMVLRPDEEDEDPYQRALFQMLGVFAELDAKIKRQNIRQGIAARQESDEYNHGPAPIGFEKDNGELAEAGDYHRVCEILERVARDEMSQREAAKELACARKTVRTAVRDRPELYGIA
ncbi:recombinase family protein [Haloarcula laminariae]|uniref:recombinase family protein n=1 Tax=Haloarcula laminariae TaxID=2961577 RepID=UPI0021C64689|nr:recombinase family protein [Halomicroarcula laminariae]